MSGTALITGITGQDGAYMTQLLISKGYTVYGTHRRGPNNFWRVDELGLRGHPQLILKEHDHADPQSSVRLLEETKAAEIYNFAGPSTVAETFDEPVVAAQIVGMGVLYMLAAIKDVSPDTRFFQASSSEMFRNSRGSPQTENAELRPCSPYGVAKAFAHWMTIQYRNDYDVFGASGILYNHESPLRGTQFVTRKITDGLVRVKLGHQDRIEVGNLDAQRDWGNAQEYVDCMYRILQHDRPDTFVVSTGRVNTVRTFIDLSCQALDIDLKWKGTGLHEVGLDTVDGREIVRVNPGFYRPQEGTVLVGDPRKARTQLGWEAQTSLEELCAMMVEAETRRLTERRGAG